MLQTVHLADCLIQAAGTFYANTKCDRFWLLVLKRHVWGKGWPNSAREWDGERLSSDILTLWYQQPWVPPSHSGIYSKKIFAVSAG